MAGGKNVKLLCSFKVNISIKYMAINYKVLYEICTVTTKQKPIIYT